MQEQIGICTCDVTPWRVRLILIPTRFLQQSDTISLKRELVWHLNVADSKTYSFVGLCVKWLILRLIAATFATSRQIIMIVSNTKFHGIPSSRTSLIHADRRTNRQTGRQIYQAPFATMWTCLTRLFANRWYHFAMEILRKYTHMSLRGRQQVWYPKWVLPRRKFVAYPLYC